MTCPHCKEGLSGRRADRIQQLNKGECVMLNDSKIAAYTAILQEELLLATGCTEPIAVAYCAAKLREVLGGKPEKILAEISGNILKNVKSVVVPNTGGRRGIDAAIAVGIVAGDADAELQVIANVTEADVAAIQTYLDSTDIRVTCPETPCLLDIKLTGWREGHHACVRVANNHTNIIYMEKDGNILRELPVTGNAEDNLQDKSVLNVQDIITFAETVPLDNIRPTVGRQIEKNTAASGPAALVQLCDCRGRFARKLRRGHRKGVARGIRRRCAHQSARLRCRRIRRTDERLRDAGGHRIRLRQSGHHRLGARLEIRQAHGRG